MALHKVSVAIIRQGIRLVPSECCNIDQSVRLVFGGGIVDGIFRKVRKQPAKRKLNTYQTKPIVLLRQYCRPQQTSRS